MTTVPWKMADKEARNVFCQQNHTFRPLTSVVSYPERGDGGNNKYRGNCSPKLIEDLIGFFKPADHLYAGTAALWAQRQRDTAGMETAGG